MRSRTTSPHRRINESADGVISHLPPPCLATGGAAHFRSGLENPTAPAAGALGLGAASLFDFAAFGLFDKALNRFLLNSKKSCRG
jgi:hypothetical protein